MYKRYLALNNQQWLLCHKIRQNQTKHTHTHTHTHLREHAHSHSHGLSISITLFWLAVFYVVGDTSHNWKYKVVSCIRCKTLHIINFQEKQQKPKNILYYNCIYYTCFSYKNLTFRILKKFSLEKSSVTYKVFLTVKTHWITQKKDFTRKSCW